MTNSLQEINFVLFYFLGSAGGGGGALGFGSLAGIAAPGGIWG